MIIDAITNPLEIEKIIRNEIIKQSGLDSSNVLNGISIRGQDLIKSIGDNIFVSYDAKDSVIIFEVVFNPSSSNNVSMTEEDESITVYASYNVNIIIYGNQSNYIANLLKSRLLTSQSRNNLQYQGIYLADISNIEPMNEFINDSLWVRNNLTLNISCRFNYSQVETENEISQLDLNKFIIINR